MTILFRYTDLKNIKTEIVNHKDINKIIICNNIYEYCMSWIKFFNIKNKIIKLVINDDLLKNYISNIKISTRLFIILPNYKDFVDFLLIINRRNFYLLDSCTINSIWRNLLENVNRNK